jgi:hypothetical protein
MFRAMFSPIIRSTWLYLQYLVVFPELLPASVFDDLELLSNSSKYIFLPVVLVLGFYPFKAYRFLYVPLSLTLKNSAC